MAILTPGERLTRDSVPVEIRMQRETGAKSTIQEARESAEREHVLAGAGGIQLERLRRRAGAGDGADQFAQADSGAGLSRGNRGLIL